MVILIRKLIHSNTRPATQLLRQADGTHLAEVLGSFSDALPMGARIHLFAKLLVGLGDEERERAFSRLGETWDADAPRNASELVLALQAEERIDAVARVMQAPSIDATAWARLLALVGVPKADATTQLPVDSTGGGDGSCGPLLPFEQHVLSEKLMIDAFREKTTLQVAPDGEVRPDQLTGGRNKGGGGKQRRGSVATPAAATAAAATSSGVGSGGAAPRRGSIMTSSPASMDNLSKEAAQAPLPVRTLPALWAQLLGRGKSLTADVWPLPRLLGAIAQLYHDRIEAEAEEERDGHERTPWPQWVLSHMVRASGVRSKALKQLNGLLHSARFYARKSLRAGTFAEV